MREAIVAIVEAYWKSRLPLLVTAVDDACRRAGELLAAQESRRSELTGGSRLARALGEFGSEALDVDVLSDILRQAGAPGDQARPRPQRLQRLVEDLEAVRVSIERTPPRPTVHLLRTSPDRLLPAFEAHVSPVCQALRLVRQVSLEARGRYDPAEHDPLFTRFDWRQLDRAELALCPPFLVIVERQPPASTQLAAVLELVASGRPLKVVLLHNDWRVDGGDTGRTLALRGQDDLTLLFVALRRVYFVQTSPASATPMHERIVGGLMSPRPAVLSVFAHGTDQEEVARRAGAALASRGFPHVVYEPKPGAAFGACLDLSDNPEPTAAWVIQPLAFVTDSGEREKLERPFTFADYAWAEPELRGQFTPLRPDQEGGAVPLAAYLNLPSSQRRDRVPFVAALDPDRRLVRLVPSQAMLAHTLDRLELWTTLQELSGIDNPLVTAMERRLREQLTAEKETALSAQRNELEAQSRAREQTQLARAFRTLVAHLTGIAVPEPTPGPAPDDAPVTPSPADCEGGGAAPVRARARDAGADRVADTDRGQS